MPTLPEGVVEEELSIPAGDVALAAVLSRPRGPAPWPAALIVSGSGPQDRDGVVVRGKETERFAWAGPDVPLYREIARALAAAGMAVLRYDDRGCGKSGGDFATATFARLAADAEAAALALKAKSGAATLCLVGHGEGGLIASQLASKLGSEPLVLLGAPGRTLDAILLEHAEDLLRAQGAKEDRLAELLAKEKRGFDRIRASEADWLEIDERRTFVGWMKERFRADPAAALKAARAERTLLFHGMRDEVVPVAHADLLVGARSGVEVHKLDGLDHAFRRTGGPVDPAFLKALVEAVAAAK